MRPTSILLDTNVCLDNYIKTRINHQDAQALIDACHRKGIDLLFSVFTLRDVYYHIGAHLKRQMREEGEKITVARASIAEQFAWKMTINLNEQGTLIPVDSSDIALARYFHEIHPDFEDDLILAAVERSGADYLVTNDRQLLSHAPVAALKPSDMLALLNGTE